MVTANKALLAKHGVELAAAAEKQRRGAQFRGGGRRRASRSIKTLREGLAGNSLARVYGILNGTCNYILTRMEQEKLSFADCLAEAQRLGYAEADPTFDVEGHDTAHKLAILASLAFGTKVDQSAVYVEGISSITPGRSRMRPTNLATASSCSASRCGPRRASSSACIRPWCRKASPIAQVMGVINAVTIDADAIAPITLVGPGAGGMATASAVVSDIADIARGVRLAPFGRPVGEAQAQRQGADAAPRGRLLHPPAGARPAGHRRDHRHAARRAEHLAGIDRPASRRAARRGRTISPGAAMPRSR